jgi:hypothetical protein
MLVDTSKDHEDGVGVGDEVEVGDEHTMYMRRLQRVTRSAMSCFIFGPTLCQMELSCRQTIASNEQKYALFTLKSARSSHQKEKYPDCE